MLTSAKLWVPPIHAKPAMVAFPPVKSVFEKVVLIWLKSPRIPPLVIVESEIPRVPEPLAVIPESAPFIVESEIVVSPSPASSMTFA